MKDEWLTEAVSNNAAWCHAIAASHGLSAHSHQSVWYCDTPMPRFYPNIVTLKSGCVIDDDIERMDPHLPPGWGIKDSFKELALDEKRFSSAFEAQWYCRPPDQPLEGLPSRGLQCKTVQSASELRRWVAAWGEGDGIFNDSLLKDDSIELIYAERSGKLECGLAINHSGASIGMSNTFGQLDDILCCVSILAARYPMKAIVGYDRDEEVAALATIGFQVVGDLRVWLRH